jgi:hypothetical protein
MAREEKMLRRLNLKRELSVSDFAKLKMNRTKKMVGGTFFAGD